MKLFGFISDKNVHEFDKIVSGKKISQIVNMRLNGMSLLHVAVGHNLDLVVLKLLQVDGIDVNPVCNNGQTPLHFAVTFGNLEMVKFLTDTKKVDLSKRDHTWKQTPLEYAERMQYWSIRNHLRSLNKVKPCAGNI